MAASTTAMSVLCTWREFTTDSGSIPTASKNVSRLRATFSAVSNSFRQKFMEAVCPVLTPPMRVDVPLASHGSLSSAGEDTHNTPSLQWAGAGAALGSKCFGARCAT